MPLCIKWETVTLSTSISSVKTLNCEEGSFYLIELKSLISQRMCSKGAQREYAMQHYRCEMKERWAKEGRHILTQRSASSPSFRA